MNSAQNRILDAEFRGADQDHQSLRLWLRLLTCTNLIESKLRNHLRLEFGCTLPRFDMLAQLESHPEGLSMGQLSQLMMVSAGNVTGTSNQVEKEGLIVRKVSAKDRRSFSLSLTPEGKEQIAIMMRSYQACLSDIFTQISEEGTDTAINMLGQLKQKILTDQAPLMRLASV